VKTIIVFHTQHCTYFLYNFSGTNLRKTNDPKLLKNALKRKAKKKAASAKAWNVRMDQVKDASTKKQQIRMHNIDARKVGGATGANLSSKRIVEQNSDGNGGVGDGPNSKKKEKRRRLGPHSGQGQNRAGFEGRKS
jgi:DNA excision repair protein ERCC-4